MDSNITYTKTSRGLRALIKKLPRNAGFVLSEIDGNLTAEEILSKLNHLNEDDLEAAITWLMEGGFIKSVVKDPFSDSAWDDASVHNAMQVDEIGLDQFTVSEKPHVSDAKKTPLKKQSKQKLSDEDKVKIKALEQADTEARERAEAALKAKLEAENKSTTEKGKLEAEEKAKLEALAKAEAEERKRAEKEAKENAKKEAAEKKKAEAEERVIEEEKRRLEAEEKAKLEALAKAEAEERKRAEKEAKENAKKEAAEKKKAEAEERVIEKTEAKEKAKLEAAARKAEKVRLRTEKKEAAKIAAEEKAAAKEQARLEAVTKNETLAKGKIEQYLDDYGDEKRKPHKGRLISLIKKWLTSLVKSIKPLSIYAMAVLFLLIIAAQFINFHIWVNPIERVAGENIQDSVNIKSVRVSFFPSPHLLLEGLTIADSTTITAEKVRVYPNLLNLKEKLLNASSSPYEVESIHVENFKIAQKDLTRIASWKGASSRDQQLKINKLSFNNMAIHLNKIELPSFNGNILLDTAGLLKKATITTENKNLTAVINHSNHKYLIDIEAIRWRAPLSPYPIFTKLSAKAAINDNELVFSNIAGTLYNGTLDANIHIDLASDVLASKGEFKVNNFFIADMAEELKLNTAVDGKLNANGKFSFNINKPVNNIFNSRLTSTFTIKNGYLKTVDLTEAMRSGNLSGYTKFTTLSGTASLSNEAYRFTKLLLRDNQLSARGQLTLSPEQYVSGTISSTIAVKKNRIRSRLAISGPLTALRIKH